jgi:hypothetical protein
MGAGSFNVPGAPDPRGDAVEQNRGALIRNELMGLVKSGAAPDEITARLGGYGFDAAAQGQILQGLIDALDAERAPQPTAEESYAAMEREALDPPRFPAHVPQPQVVVPQYAQPRDPRTPASVLHPWQYDPTFDRGPTKPSVAAMDRMEKEIASVDRIEDLDPDLMRKLILTNLTGTMRSHRPNVRMQAAGAVIKLLRLDRRATHKDSPQDQLRRLTGASPATPPDALTEG